MNWFWPKKLDYLQLPLLVARLKKFGNKAFVRVVWKNVVPPKVLFFCWQALLGKVPTRDVILTTDFVCLDPVKCFMAQKRICCRLSTFLQHFLEGCAMFHGVMVAETYPVLGVERFVACWIVFKI